MTCYAPLPAWKPLVAPGGDKRLFFRPPRGGEGAALKIAVPCGQCIGCRLERSRQWALRCLHEASLYERNCFLTLTYSDQFLPPLNSLRFRDFQLFMKRLRKIFGSSIRFFHCGEYGDDTKRPHYHALIFNFDFDDKVVHAISRDGHRLYTSESLDRIWGLGFCVIGSVSFESAAYVARYCVKKFTGFAAEAAYEVVDPVTGEVLGRRAAEYATMSRRPGIGGGWYEKYSGDVFPSDSVVHNGVPMRPPKSYDRYLERDDPELMRRVRAAREREARLHMEDNTPERLFVRETVKLAQVSSLKRKL